MTDALDRRTRARSMWGLGDYGEVAIRMQPAADATVDAARIAPATRVVDVAAGTGNAAVAAARRGATVVATDFSPELVARGRERCSRAGLAIEWREADAEDLPFGEGEFDGALSTFGVSYAPRAEVAAAELFRVVHRGGVVAVANWAQGSFQDVAAAALQPFAGPPAVASLDWGDELAVRALFVPHASTVEVVHATMGWCFDSVDEWLERAERVSPPLVALRESLPPEHFEAARWALRDAVEPFVTRTPGGVVLEQHYVIVVARKR